MLARKFHGLKRYYLQASIKIKSLFSTNFSTQGCIRLLLKKSGIEVERPLSFFLSVLSQPDMAPIKKHVITTIRKRLKNFFITDTKPFYFCNRNNRPAVYPYLSAKSAIVVTIIVDTIIKNRFSTLKTQFEIINKFL